MSSLDDIRERIKKKNELIEEQKAEENKTATLFGVTVPTSVYDEYMNNDYREFIENYPYESIPIRLYDLKEASKHVDLYGNSAEKYKKDMSDLYNAIQQEIIEKYGNTDKESEDLKVMKHDNFTGYIDDVAQAYKDLMVEREKIEKDILDNEEEWNEARKEATGDKLLILQGEYAKRKLEIQTASEELEKKARERIGQIKEDFSAHADNFFSPNSAMIDNDTVTLLNSGIAFSDNEITAMADKHKGNPTMLRILSDYCNKNEIRNPRVISLSHSALNDKDSILGSVEACSNVLMKAVSTTDKTSHVWRKQENFDKVLADARASIGTYTVQPEALEE